MISNENNENKNMLYQRQKELLDTFLSTGAITPEQYAVSLNGLKTKMGIILKNEDKEK